MAEKTKKGKCFLVGAGPGDLGLVTLRARECVERAEVIVYDYLCNPEMLRWAPENAERIFAGKKAGAHTLTQEQINALLVEKTREGKTVVRLKGGDPFLFGRGGEEAQALAAGGLPFVIVPGVTSAIAGPAYAGIWKTWPSEWGSRVSPRRRSSCLAKWSTCARNSIGSKTARFLESESW
jgi:uroporphyrinogen III methyltransferase/synthase